MKALSLPALPAAAWCGRLFDTLPRRWLAVMALALVLGHAAVAGLWALGGDGLHPVSREQAVERVASALRLAQTIRPERAPVLLDAAGSLELQMHIAAAPSVDRTAMSADERRFAEDVGRRLPRLPSALRVQLGPLAGTDEGAQAGSAAWPGHGRSRGLRVAARLDEGRWLNLRIGPVHGRPWRSLVAWSLAATLPLGLMTWWFVQRILRPWRALVAAADRGGRGEQVPELPRVGPRELRDLTHAFNLMQARQARFVGDRTRLLAAISHDLRTPITSLRLRVALIDDPALSQAMAQTLAVMSAMVEETLVFAREDGRGEPTTMLDLSQLCAEVVDEYRVAGHDIVLQAPPSQPLRGRPLALRRAVSNLAGNAIRHGGRARLHLHRTGAGEIVLDVDDDGPGIPPEQMAHVFEPYFRADAAHGGGVGLGLAIARSCVQSHGGTLTLANRSAGGLRARIELPAA